jgi:hypothetical protein
MGGSGIILTLRSEESGNPRRYFDDDNDVIVSFISLCHSLEEDGSVSIVARNELDRRVAFLVGAGISSLRYRVQTNMQATQILVRWIPLALSAKIKQ